MRSMCEACAKGGNHAFNIAPNLLNRDFHADGPDQEWGEQPDEARLGDPGIEDSARPLSSDQWRPDLASTPAAQGCIHHTDRGSQYCSHDYQKLLRQHGFHVSMSGKGNCYDNSAVDVRHGARTGGALRGSLFKTIKAELIWRKSWPTRRDAELAIFQYINGFYNPRRRHSALGWKSPVVLERKVA